MTWCVAKPEAPEIICQFHTHSHTAVRLEVAQEGVPKVSCSTGWAYQRPKLPSTATARTSLNKRRAQGRTQRVSGGRCRLDLSQQHWQSLTFDINSASSLLTWAGPADNLESHHSQTLD